MDNFDERAKKAADAVHQQLQTQSQTKDFKSRPSLVKTLPATALVIGLLVAALVLPGRSDNEPVLASALTPLADCESALDYFKENAIGNFDFLNGGARVEPFGDVTTQSRVDSAVAATTESYAKSSSAPANNAPGYSTTNVQEVGVDEPDVVKSNGKRVVAVAGGQVNLIDVTGVQPQLRATLPEVNVNNVLVDGDRLLLIGTNSDQYGIAQDGFGYGSKLSVYDIADSSNPKKLSALTFSGQVVDARLVGSQVRVAAASSPTIKVPLPEYRDGAPTQQSKDALNDAVAKSQIGDWVPRFKQEGSTGELIAEGQLVECDRLAHPNELSGLQTVSINSFDLNDPVGSRKSTGVVAGGDHVYATQDAMYLATMRSNDENVPRSSVHKFVNRTDGTPEYRASGFVDGFVLNQYSMDEEADVLRVASTVRNGQSSEGVVTTLQESGNQLRQLGRVGGLGADDNESIKSVRFIGNKGYVVTFRETDPLYVIDLNNARSPRVVGELKIPGFSGYLHPLDGDRLIGVGQGSANNNATSNVQFSLFDVSNAASPKRINVETYGEGQAEFDPRAFLYWQPRNLVIAPVNTYSPKQFNGLVMLRPEANGLQRVGELEITDSQYRDVRRSFVIDNRIYLLTGSGLQVNSLESHKKLSELRLGAGRTTEPGIPEFRR